MSDVYSKAQHRVGWAGGIIACSRDEDTPRYRGSGELYPASALWWGRTLGCKATETSMGWRDAPRLNNLDVGGRSDTSPSGRFRTTRVPSPLIQTSTSTSDSLPPSFRLPPLEDGSIPLITCR
ncbi:Aldo/keto reductase [Alternaria alternata]|nr:Aldo/keto reductase [Alternaria alternata]